MKSFENKTAVITGAASGIGRALARHAGKNGMRLALADMNGGALETLKKEFDGQGIECLTSTLDVSDSQAVENFSRRCFETFGQVDLLFNNAGILKVGSCWEHSAEDWQKMLGVNVMGVINGINAFVPRILEAGNEAHIVNTGSVGSLVAAPFMGQYTTCKMAVRGLSESLHFDLKASGAPVGVSILCPGPVVTPIGDTMMGEEPGDKVVESHEHRLAGTPGFIYPEECAEIVFDAVSEGKFWIFTHPFSGHYRAMTEAMLNGENPEYKDVEFDD